MSITNFPGGFPGGVTLHGNYVGGSSGSIYFVDGNSGNDGNNGTSWEDAMKTLAVAIAASDVDIARGSDRWARRNVIYCVGDRLTETLTTFPDKCDIVGVGSVDGFIGCGLRGNHAPVSSFGTRFFNMHFDPTSAADIITLDSTDSFIEFHSCRFKAAGAATAVGAIDSTACQGLKVEGCDFMGAFSGDVIDIGAGAANMTRIVDNNIIGGADNGIVITGVATVTGSERGLIAYNDISVADKVIDTRAVSVFDCMRNTCISGEALGGSSYVIDLTFAAGNLITCNDVSVTVPSYTTVG